ncbi:hypothetical protein [Arthrobacter sp. Soil762]|uniref:hypothetical protein n=1 Tax=Arthrobacter sp. Soil762 TaxID=1736401 RepID=UPI000AE61551|nr:hypothetical protein [Arthrobacter sp. Soil762]
MTYRAEPRYFSAVPETDISAAHMAAEKMNIFLFPQGEQVASLLEAKNEDGTPLYPAAVIMMGRRATKTSSIQATLLGRCLTIPGYRIISTAQNGSMASQFLAELGSTLESTWPDENSRPFKFYKSNGNIRIVFENGSQWKCTKPLADGFRGSYADCILIDEAGELDPKTSEDLVAGALPVLATRPNAQIIITGTPPKVRDGILWDYLQAGRKGTDELGILDYSMRPDQDATDESLWWEIYPGLSSGLVKLSFLRKAFETQGLLSFSREFLCLDPVAASIRAIPEEDWLATQVENLLELPKDNYAVAFDIAQDGSSAAVAVAWYTSDGQPHVQVLQHKASFSWMPMYLGKLLTSQKGLEVGFDSIGNNLSVFQTIQRMKQVPKQGLRAMTMKEVSSGVALMTSHISDHALVHAKDPSLDTAAAEVAFRYVSDSRLFGRRQSSTDISPLIAASNALFLAAGKSHSGAYKKRQVILL